MTASQDSRPSLDALCRSVRELLDTPRGTPTRLRVEAGNMAVEVEWPAAPAEGSSGAPAGGPSGGAAVPAAPADAAGTADAPDTGAGHAIVAPTVGTFYHAPEPGAAPFVQVGDLVEPGRQVGIVEVMKLMMPVEAERHGRVTQILVPDGAPVEHGQPLVLLEDADREPVAVAAGGEGA